MIKLSFNLKKAKTKDIVEKLKNDYEILYTTVQQTSFDTKVPMKDVELSIKKNEKGTRSTIYFHGSSFMYGDKNSSDLVSSKDANMTALLLQGFHLDDEHKRMESGRTAVLSNCRIATYTVGATKFFIVTLKLKHEEYGVINMLLKERSVKKFVFTTFFSQLEEKDFTFEITKFLLHAITLKVFPVVAVHLIKDMSESNINFNLLATPMLVNIFNKDHLGITFMDNATSTTMNFLDYNNLKVTCGLGESQYMGSSATYSLQEPESKSKLSFTFINPIDVLELKNA